MFNERKVSFCQNIADENAVPLTFSYIFDGFVNYTTFWELNYQQIIFH